jgi:hypothetical protein
MASKPIALNAADAAPRKAKSNYPENFVSRLGDRVKRPLGDPFGLSIFGVNLTRLPPGAMSALRHAHTRQDEFIYILEGTPTLITESGETMLKPEEGPKRKSRGRGRGRKRRAEGDRKVIVRWKEVPATQSRRWRVPPRLAAPPIHCPLH